MSNNSKKLYIDTDNDVAFFFKGQIDFVINIHKTYMTKGP